MTKEALKSYLIEAVEALDGEDINQLFPEIDQPDLYTLVEALTGMQGAFHKLSDTNFTLNKEVKILINQVLSSQEKASNHTSSNIDIESVLWRLITMDELLQLTHTSFLKLPKFEEKNRAEFTLQFNSWSKGLSITMERWDKLLLACDLKKVGFVGELFDPHIHEAVGSKNWTNIANNTIVEVEQVGYKNNGILLRTAKVIVNKLKEGTIQKTLLDNLPIEKELTVNKNIQEQKEKQPNKKKSKKKKKRSYKKKVKDNKKKKHFFGKKTKGKKKKKRFCKKKTKNS